MFLLPVEKDNPVYSQSRVVLTFVAFNVVIFLAQQFGAETRVFHQFGFISATPHVSTLFSHMFIHAGFFHLLGNMFFLWMFGDNVEDVLGRVTFFIAYFVCGVGAVAAQYLADPHSVIPLVGASGAISGVVALYVTFFPKVPFELAFYFGRWEVCTWSVTCKVAVCAWLAEQLLLATVTSLTHSVGIAFWAHVGGFVIGALLGVFLLAFGWKERFEARVAMHAPVKRKKRQQRAASASA